MFPLSYPLALCLITCPGLEKECGPGYTPRENLLGHLYHFRHLKAEVLSVCLHLEVWKAGNPNNHFIWDLACARGNYEKMKGYPPMRDAHRFPDRSTAELVKEVNRAYRKRLLAWMEMYPHQHGGRDTISEATGGEFLGEYNVIQCLRIDRVIREVDWIHDIWWLVGNLGSDDFYVRRSNLNDLRKLIGPRDFYLGALPEPVPYWRCVRVD